MQHLISIAVILLLSSSITFAQDFCKSDFDYNGMVDANDVITFLNEFGRSHFHNPCPPDGPSPVCKSGQTTSYYTGDDGDLEKGVPWPNPRFNDRGNGTVVDNLSGLTWLKDANCFGTRTWNNALSDCNGLASGQCGLTDGSSAGDWRLANLFELETLRDPRYYGPCLSNTEGTGQWSEGDPFTNVNNGNGYFSSTTFAYLPLESAWVVDMNEGFVRNDPGSKTGLHHVWPVRGGR